jgi:hypothetical protein
MEKEEGRMMNGLPALSTLWTIHPSNLFPLSGLA